MKTVLNIRNHHIEACGDPPKIDQSEILYLGYFENEYREQMIFIKDKDGKCWFWSGDYEWSSGPRKINKNNLHKFSFSKSEALWLATCLLASDGVDP